MRLSVSTRIFLAFTVVIVAFGATCAYTVWRMTSVRESVTVIWQEVMPVSAQLKELSRRLRAPEAFLALRTPSDAQWVSRLLPSLQPFDAMRRIEERIGEVVASEALPEEDRRRLRAVVGTLRDFREGDALADALGDDDLAATAAAGVRTSEQLYDWLVQRTARMASDGFLGPDAPETRAMVRTLRRVNSTVILASRAVAEPVRSLSSRASAEEKNAILAVVLIATAALVLSLAMLAMIQLTLRPIRQLREGARRIAAGDYDERVAVRARNEVGQLADEFNGMAAALAARDAELARQRVELLRADRLATIGKLAAQITHEIRNPLSSIGLNAELLDEELGELDAGDEPRALLGAIQQEVDRLKAITEEYLAYARMPRPERRPLDLVDEVERFLAFVVREVAGAGVALERRGLEEARGVRVDADADQLRQAFLNVARNALDALRDAAPPRRLEVSVAYDGAARLARVRFADSGPGLDPALRERVFEPFVTGKAGGTGLGLALTEQIVTEHGGRVSAGAPGLEGRGAVFEIALPATDPPTAIVRGAG